MCFNTAFSGCGHCKRLAPVWDQLAEKVGADHAEEGILTAKVDCTTEKAVCQRFKIRGYPTLVYFAERKMFRYSGPRELDDLVAYATGGYQDTSGEAVPAPPSFVKEKMTELRKLVNDNEHLKHIVEDFQHIVEIRKNAAAVLVGIGALIGLMLGCILGGGGGGGGKTKVKKA